MAYLRAHFTCYFVLCNSDGEGCVLFLTQGKELHELPYPVEQVIRAESHVEPMEKRKQATKRDRKYKE